MNFHPRAIPTMRRTAAATTRRDDVGSSLSIARALWKLAKRGTKRGVIPSSSRIVEPCYCYSSVLQHTCNSMLQSYYCSSSNCSSLHTYCSYCRCADRYSTPTAATAEALYCSTPAVVCSRATAAAVCTPTATTAVAVYCNSLLYTYYCSNLHTYCSSIAV
ncbi:hypothetical protein BHM03_00041620 [Ensete ventricosum]|nr:hypothetical protein BHM03_00041620 [Ensete ventricosum]